jgi:hypothetical protein
MGGTTSLILDTWKDRKVTIDHEEIYQKRTSTVLSESIPKKTKSKISKYTSWKSGSLGKCFNANSLWQVYLGSVLRKTPCPYPGTTCKSKNSKTLLSGCQQRLLNRRIWNETVVFFLKQSFSTKTCICDMKNCYKKHKIYYSRLLLVQQCQLASFFPLDLVKLHRSVITQLFKALSCIGQKIGYFSKSFFMVWPIVFFDHPLPLIIGLSSITSALSLVLLFPRN